MSFVLDEDFEWFIEKFGYPKKTHSVSEEILNEYQGCLPNRLLEYWQEYGFCNFKDELFWIVNPKDYQDSIESWLK